MIESLTDAQIAKLPEYVKKWVDIGLNTDPCNFAVAKEAVIEIYKSAKQTPPEWFIGPINNPYEAMIVDAILLDLANKEVQFKDNDDLNKKVNEELEVILQQKEQPRRSIYNQIYGFQDYWLSYYDYFQTECAVKFTNAIEPFVKLAKNCGWWTPLQNVAILQHRPLEIHRDNQNRLHNLNGPAVKYRGSEKSDVYAVHGVRVTKKIINKEFTANDITAESNAEVRRVMIDIYGDSQYIVDSGAKAIHTDDFGTLYVKELQGDETIMMVKVINSTPKPDGSFKEYWIRVDPKAYGGLKTARAAIASTWRHKVTKNGVTNLDELVFKSPDDYDCDIET
jgi:hypothetical protein